MRDAAYGFDGGLRRSSAGVPGDDRRAEAGRMGWSGADCTPSFANSISSAPANAPACETQRLWCWVPAVSGAERRHPAQHHVVLRVELFARWKPAQLARAAEGLDSTPEVLAAAHALLVVIPLLQYLLEMTHLCTATS